jgi:hypothetical protein
LTQLLPIFVFLMGLSIRRARWSPFGNFSFSTQSSPALLPIFYFLRSFDCFLFCDVILPREAFSVHQKLQPLKIDIHFSEAKVSVSFSMAYRPYSQLVSMKSNVYPFSSSSLDVNI